MHTRDNAEDQFPLTGLVHSLVGKGGAVAGSAPGQTQPGKIRVAPIKEPVTIPGLMMEIKEASGFFPLAMEIVSDEHGVCEVLMPSNAAAETLARTGLTMEGVDLTVETSSHYPVNLWSYEKSDCSDYSGEDSGDDMWDPEWWEDCIQEE
jgi:hypothetical protein